MSAAYLATVGIAGLWRVPLVEAAAASIQEPVVKTAISLYAPLMAGGDYRVERDRRLCGWRRLGREAGKDPRFRNPLAG